MIITQKSILKIDFALNNKSEITNSIINAIEMIHKSLLLRLVAKPGKEVALQQLLQDGLRFVNEEPKTVTWYAFKINETTFGIFDTFPDEEGLHVHHSGKLAETIMKAAPELLAENPIIEVADVLAYK